MIKEMKTKKNAKMNQTVINWALIANQEAGQVDTRKIKIYNHNKYNLR